MCNPVQPLPAFLPLQLPIGLPNRWQEKILPIIIYAHHDRHGWRYDLVPPMQRYLKHFPAFLASQLGDSRYFAAYWVYKPDYLATVERLQTNAKNRYQQKFWAVHQPGVGIRGFPNAYTDQLQTVWIVQVVRPSMHVHCCHAQGHSLHHEISFRNREKVPGNLQPERIVGHIVDLDLYLKLLGEPFQAEPCQNSHSNVVLHGAKGRGRYFVPNGDRHFIHSL